MVEGMWIYGLANTLLVRILLAKVVRVPEQDPSVNPIKEGQRGRVIPRLRRNKIPPAIHHMNSNGPSF